MADIIQSFPSAGGSASYPEGGATGSALVKKSDANNDVEWKTIDLDSKVDKVEGKGLSTNDYTNEDKSKIDSIDNKVDKIEGKGLSTNDYTTEEKNRLANITIDIDNKVDKIEGKGLSTNDYTTLEKNKLAGLENYDDTAIKGRVKAIEDVVPSEATATNKLATISDVEGIATDYDTLKNKPQIAGITLSGNKALSDLGIQPSTLTTAVNVEGENKTTVQEIANAVGVHTEKTVTDTNGAHGFKVTTGNSTKIFYKSGNDWNEITLGDVTQSSSLPAANKGNLGKIFQYIGDTTEIEPIYKHGYFYECVGSEEDGIVSYSWENIPLMDVQEVQKNNLPQPSINELGNIYQYVGDTTENYVKGYYYECIKDGSIYKWAEKKVQSGGGQIIQYDIMPTADGTNVNKIIHYVGNTTETTPIYINGYFYKCIELTTEPVTYEWKQTDVQPSKGVSQEDLATAEDVQEVKDIIDMMYGFDVLAHDEDVQAVKDIIDQINDFIPYYV